MNIHFFSGRLLSADAMQAEQSYATPQRLLDKVALNPQPLPPREAAHESAVAQADGGSAFGMQQIQDLLSTMQNALHLADSVSRKHEDTTDSVIGKIG